MTMWIMIAIAVAVVALAVGGYFWWFGKSGGGK